jgi:hypothetical protein
LYLALTKQVLSLVFVDMQRLRKNKSRSDI